MGKRPFQPLDSLGSSGHRGAGAAFPPDTTLAVVLLSTFQKPPRVLLKYPYTKLISF